MFCRSASASSIPRKRERRFLFDMHGSSQLLLALSPFVREEIIQGAAKLLRLALLMLICMQVAAIDLN